MWWARVNVCAGRGCSSAWHQQEERSNASKREREREFVAATEVQKDGATRARIVVIDWLAATEHVKNVNQALSIARAFARFFAKHRQCDISEVMGSTRRVHFETLRRARILVDAVAPLVWRQRWRDLIPPSASSWEQRLPWAREWMSVLRLEDTCLTHVARHSLCFFKFGSWWAFGTGNDSFLFQSSLHLDTHGYSTFDGEHGGLHP